MRHISFKRPIQRGFTLIEVLLVVAIIAILAGIVIIAVNPSKQIADSQNAQRSSDVSTILNAVYQYALDNNGTLPATITTTATEVCSTTGATCSANSKVDLGVLTTNSKYVVSIPKDPKCASVCSTVGTGYKILKNSNNRVTVTATYASGKTISVTR